MSDEVVPHTVPVAELGLDTLSTSARLREVQADLAASQADLTRTLQERDAIGVKLVQALRERDELLSIVARIGDAISPTGERPEEALGTLAADVESCVAMHDVVEDERDRLREDQTHMINALAAVIVEMDERRAERDAARSALKTVNEALALTRAELASARQEIASVRNELGAAQLRIEQLRAARQWIVARDGGRGCERCEREVRRGEAYELQPGTGGLVQHVHCPDLPLPDNQNGATGV